MTARRRQRRTTVATGGIVVLLVAVIAILARPALRAFVSSPSCRVTAPSGTFGITTSQARYAATIAAVGERDGMPDHAVSVALATALQESKLRNLDYGDRDSLGLFQQRPSQGWGSATEVLDPVYSANAFYQALTKVPNWREVSVTTAAQDVQHSGAPEAYETWAAEGRSLAEAFTGEASAALTCGYQASGGVAPGVVSAAAADELGSPLPGQTPTTPQAGWKLASWLVGRGQGFGVSSVSYDGWMWTAATGHWANAAVPAVNEVTYTAATTPG